MRKNLLVSFLALVLIGWSYWSYTQFFAPSTKTEGWGYSSEKLATKTYDEIQAENAEKSKQDSALYNVAVESQDRTICESITQIELKTRCQDMVGATLAIRWQNIELCSSLSSSGMIEKCQDNVKYARAESTHEVGSCSTIQSETLAKSCQVSLDTFFLEARVASGSVDADFCATLTDEVRENCTAKVTRTDDRSTYEGAIALKNLKDCDRISNEILRSQCRDAIIFDLAITEKNIDLCVSISNVNRARYCEESLSTRTDREKYQSLIAEDDIEACTTLRSPELQNQCHDIILIARVRSSQDTAACSELYNTGMISSCEKIVR